MTGQVIVAGVALPRTNSTLGLQPQVPGRRPPVAERAVPQDGAPGEALSPTQTFPVGMPALVPQTLRPEDGFGFMPMTATHAGA